MHTAQSNSRTNKLEGSKKPMPNGEQITRHVAKIPRREFTTSLLHPLPIIVKQPCTADTARWRGGGAVNIFRKSPLHKLCLDERTCLYELWDSLCFACKLALLTVRRRRARPLSVVVVFTLKARFLVKKETILRIIDLSMKRAAGQRRQRPATALLLRLVAGN